MEEKEKTTMVEDTRSSSMAATTTPIVIVVDALPFPANQVEGRDGTISEITKNICKTKEYICWMLYTKYILNPKI